MKKILKKVGIVYLCCCLLSTIVLNVNIISAKQKSSGKQWNSENLEWKNKVKDRLEKCGAPENDIKKLSDEELAQLNSSDNVQVEVKYYHVEDKTGNVEVLNDDEIDSLLENLESEKESDDGLKVSLNPLDLISETASARTEADIKTTSGGYLRQALYISSTSNSSIYNVLYTAEWLIKPANRKIDVFGVGFDNVYYTGNGVTAYQCANRKIYTRNYIPTTAWKLQSEGPVSRSATQIDSYATGVAVTENLYSDVISYDSQERREYTNHYLHLSFSIVLKDEHVEKFPVYGFYRHQETQYQITPSVSGISPSAGISVSYSEIMFPMLPNPYKIYIR